MIKIGFLEISWVDVADIVLVSYLIYRLYKLIKGSVAVRIFIGIISIYLVYLIVKAAEMELLTAILGQFIGLGVIAALILFQPEIRKFLLVVGKTSLFKNDLFGKVFLSDPNAPSLKVEALVNACTELSRTKTGGLIVIGKRTELQPYIDTGNYMDAYISVRLLLSIFFKNSPMHDGAVIIADNKIKAAGCILPVTENTEIPHQLGLRHRAAIGITEQTESMVIIVSEEQGTISVATHNKPIVTVTPDELRQKLNKHIEIQ